MAAIAGRLDEIKMRISQACHRAGRVPDEIRLLAVSKTFPASCVREAYAAGQLDFGESRQQEAATKVAELPQDIRWHFIGKLQRNKVRKVLADFEVIHSIDSLKLASHVDRIAGEMGVHPSVFLEVNLAGEESKSGFEVESIRREIAELKSLSHLFISGLMVIPPDHENPEAMRPWFARARELRDMLRGTSGLELPELSMGMSGDFEVAIEEGSSIVRVGSAIFGER